MVFVLEETHDPDKLAPALLGSIALSVNELKEGSECTLDKLLPTVQFLFDSCSISQEDLLPASQNSPCTG